MPTLPLYLVDAFTPRPFAGNPAGVCLLDQAREAGWMQSVAAEMNQAETAFLEPREGEWKLRWFTPSVEVDLCGHATLASAHVLWESGRSQEPTLRFHTRSGVLSARRVQEGAGSPRIELDFPALLRAEVTPPAGLLPALGIDRALWIGGNKMDYFVELESAAELRALRPDHTKLRASTQEVRGVIVTAKSDTPDYHFISRFFAPGSGIDEDPVTGSAHCALAPYWSAKLGLTTMTGYQASPRGGVVEVELRGDRVLLRGSAVTVMAGELRV
ncbi:MAG: PhzF family phenazine biosynthesis protein [Candidatus Eisenbacteria bacterium]